MIVDKRMMSFAGGGLLGVACILYIVCNALPMWSKLQIDPTIVANVAQQLSDLGFPIPGFSSQTPADIKSITIAYGLWQGCASVNGNSTCVSIYSKVLPSNINAQMLAARAFITIACILSGIATVCVVVCGFVKEDSSGILVRLAKVLPFATLVGGIIGVAVGIVYAIPSSVVRIGVASILGIIAVVFNLIGAIVVLFIK